MSRKQITQEDLEAFQAQYPGFAESGSEESREDEEQIPGGLSSGRGRPKIPPHWTRVIDVDSHAGEQLRKFQLSIDLLMESS